ncbi:MAG: hypothetical protein BMS9Abin05_2411 [Rhodothermia bacterium]|nr:MAG: hypothetical protein BMS9Abin05_2411 [Rhodothermia bacterium]
MQRDGDTDANEPGVPALSIVVGSHNAESSILDCLRALGRQTETTETELLVVDNSTDGTSDLVESHFPNIRLLKTSHLRHIPELWAEGIRCSRGSIVAITTAHCIPDRDWVERILRAHDKPHAGIGGAIESEGVASLTSWAVYFCRYSRYMLPFQSTEDVDLAGDNASYKRQALDRHAQTWQDGFWEPTVHAALLKSQERLMRDPSIIVRHRRSFGIRSFLANRYEHGREFGFTGAFGQASAIRAGMILRTPLVPFVMTARAGREIFLKKRHRLHFLLVLPLVLIFYTAWSFGELSGTLRTFYNSPATDVNI